ncbi:MAG: hypothetical protein ACD_9C00194G0002 [uncultured bacterium]|nr:MAG: hypothetical protein ACD_9C00194G0002 [uncultured bacterium]
MEQFYCPVFFNKVSNSSLPKMSLGIQTLKVDFPNNFNDMRKKRFFTNRNSFQLACKIDLTTKNLPTVVPRYLQP